MTVCPVLAAELGSLRVDVIFANSAPAALAAKRTTTSVPIVFETLGELITAGLVTRLGGEQARSEFLSCFLLLQLTAPGLDSAV
jgi:hypothetical protein